MQDIVLVGAGGHCRSVIDVIESTGLYKIAAIVDKAENIGNEILSYKITHSDADIQSLAQKNLFFLITVGQIKSPAVRMRIYQDIKNHGGKLATVISSRAYVSKHASLGEGTIVMHGAIVNSAVKVGANCIVNSQALIEHDAQVGDHCHISTAAVLNGGVIVGSGSFIGSNSVVHENLTVPSDSVIAAGFIYSKRQSERSYEK